jgi:ubiquinone/menaquinone biosynthesis C-methylase UbiE
VSPLESSQDVSAEALGFGGEVAGLYRRYRHGYPAAIFDILTDEFRLGRDDVAVDLGCGTGQLTLPLARRVRAVTGIDPEPDMLHEARTAARDAGLTNITWTLGADADLPALGALLGDGAVAAVTVGQALHWMRPAELFATARRLVRRAGGVAVITNGTPLWLQDSDWSRGLLRFLREWRNTTTVASCGTDQQSQRRYAGALTDAGFAVTATAVDYVADLSFDELAGGLMSAIPVSLLPAPGERAEFRRRIRAAVGDAETFREPVHVAVLLGRRPD